MATVYLEQATTFDGQPSETANNWITQLLITSDAYSLVSLSANQVVLVSTGVRGYPGYTIVFTPNTTFSPSTNGVDLFYGDIHTAELRDPNGAPVSMLTDLPRYTYLYNISGTLGSTAIVGSSGADTIYAFSGLGSSVDGGAGDDVIYGGLTRPGYQPVSDTLAGGPGADKIYGRDGDDFIIGGDGADFIDAGTGTDLVMLTEATGAIDVYIDQAAAPGAITILGAELIMLGDHGTRVFGGAGVDAIIGGLGADEIHGGLGADLIAGLDGADRLYGDDGDDVFDLGAGDDFVDGGAGVDLVDFSANTAIGVTVDLSNTGPQFTGQGQDTLIGVEDLFGTNLPDVLTGNESNNHFYGEGGADVLYGNGGSDQLEGGYGDDTLVGGTGADILIGGAGQDAYYVDSLLDQVIEAKDEGFDTVYTTIDYVLGANVEGLSLNAGAVHGVGNALGNWIVGNNDANWLEGLGETDMLSGGGGADTLDGGQGADELIGGAGADVLIGGGGFDVFRGSLAEMNGDTIVDLTAGDAIVITDANLATFSVSRQGATVTLSGGIQFTLGGNPKGELVASAEPGGGVRLKLVLPDAPPVNDINGDGHSDILWQHSAGYLTIWLGGGTAAGPGFAANVWGASVSPGWKLETTLDFNGDGAADLMWRHANGTFSIWDATTGGFLPNSFVTGAVGADWKLAGTGDFDGDGKSDLLWRHANGAYTEWRSTGDSFETNVVVGAMHPDFKVAAIGDFTGDGVDDVLWRNDKTGAATVAASQGDSFFFGALTVNNVGVDWTLAGHGDFNGDGKEDIIWRNADGVFTEWQSTGTGFMANVYVDSSVAAGWSLASVSDYNGDGRDDLMWRHPSGVYTVWQSTGNGFMPNVYVDGSVSADWTVV
jgi:Ca2+-binding RTX toxin-like protein